MKAEFIPEEDKKVNDGDTVDTIANKIYKYFKVGQSVTITGLEEDDDNGKRVLFIKGELVLRFLNKLYENDYTRVAHNRPGRKRTLTYPLRTIGGPNKHPQWKYEKHTRNGEPVMTIWRVQ